jgi:hypothetical protein
MMAKAIGRRSRGYKTRNPQLGQFNMRDYHVRAPLGQGFYPLLSAGGEVITPTVQVTNIVVTNIADDEVAFTWTEGNGSNSLVLMKAAGAVDALPSDGTGYTANTVFGSGSELGTGNFVVYGGTGNSVNVTGLTQNVTYHIRIITFNGAGAGSLYFTDTATGNPASFLSFTTQMQAWIDRLVTLVYSVPDLSQLILLNAKIRGDIADSTFANSDAEWNHAVQYQDAATVNFISPAIRQATLVNSPTFTSNKGFTGNGTTQYINYGVTLSGLTKYLQDDASIECFVGTNLGTGGAFIFGANTNANGFGGSGSWLNPRNASDTLSATINDAGANISVSSISTSIGYHKLRRTAINLCTLFKNGSSLGTDTSNSETRVAIVLFGLCSNGNGTPTGFTARQLGFMRIGAASAGNEVNAYNRWNTYYTSI